MNKIFNNLFLEKTLTVNEAKNLILDILKGKINEFQTVAIISVYNMRSPTIEELIGFCQGMKELSFKINFHEFNAIDIVGTGGDKYHTFNISTIACFIVAGTGEKVIKHGNFSSSSITGSSNILQTLGYNFSIKENDLKNQLNKVGICYLHAPIFYPLLEKLSFIRKNLGFKTIFNTLGPLLNPANPKNQFLGVNSLELARIYHYLYQDTKKKYCNYAIVHSIDDGYDEITLTNDIKCYTKEGEQYFSLKELNKNQIKINLEEIKGGNNVQENTQIFLDILSGKGTPTQNEIVLINATFALKLLNKDSFGNNYDRAKYSLESGKAKNILKKLLNL